MTIFNGNDDPTYRLIPEIASSASMSADRFVELLCQAQARQAEVHFFSLGQGDAHVFDEVLDIEAGLEIAGHDARAQDFKGLAAGGADAHRLEDGFEIEAGFVAVEQPFAERDHVRGDEDL